MSTGNSKMKKFAITVAGVAALAAVAFGPAGTAGASGARADDTVNSLQPQGYRVQLNGSSSSPLSSCTVTNVSGVSELALTADSSPTAIVDIACPTGC